VTFALAHRRALVTGASRGIGRAITLALSRAGMLVDAVARDREALARLADESHPAGAISPRPCDLAELAQLGQLVDHVETPAVLVNAAGWAPPRNSIEHGRMEDWDRTLDVCLRAPMELVRRVLPAMLRARQPGAIVQISSPAARRGRAGEAAYCAAKAGLRGFTESLRDELRGSDIKVISIVPGYVDTDLIPANRRIDRGRFLSPEDVAEAVVYCLDTSARCCPEEVVLDPQHDPLRREG
jgi:3-oxoacyl-[acyl-carrier protein] reductase